MTSAAASAGPASSAALDRLLAEYQALKAENARLKGEPSEKKEEAKPASSYFISSLVGQAFKHLAYQTGTIAAVVGAVEGYFGGGILGSYIPSGLLGGLSGYFTGGPIGAAAGYYGIGSAGTVLGTVGAYFGGGAAGAVAAGTVGCVGAATGVLLVGKMVEYSMNRTIDLALWTAKLPFRITGACLSYAMSCLCCSKR